MTTPFKIAIAGLGTVGGGVVKALMARQDLWELVRFMGSPKIMRQPQRPIAAVSW